VFLALKFEPNILSKFSKKKLTFFILNKDMFAICIISHGGTDDEIEFSDGVRIRLHTLLSVNLNQKIIRQNIHNFQNHHRLDTNKNEVRDVIP
jgi:hypothetical protein